MKFNTKLIHAGIHSDETTGAVMTPIYQTSTYEQSKPGVHKGFEYSRTQNPTRKALEDNIAALEGAEYGLCFASGMAAMDCILKLLNPGDEIICANDVYGGTYRILTKVYQNYNIQPVFTDFQDIDALGNMLSSKTKMIWLETPSNPLLQIIDIKAVAALCKDNNILLVVDNTFATPYLQSPISLGADIVVHSATKYLGGHSDVVLGSMAFSDAELYDKLSFYQNSCGGVPGPMDCFLALRGIKTLHVRMDRHSSNAMEIAQFLNNHPSVEEVYYPGLENHSGHQLAKSQMKGFGGMVSFKLKEDTTEKAYFLLEKLTLFKIAESLGGVESLAGHPATMTHAAIPREERVKNGIADSLIRLSVGIEDAEDLKADIKQALS